MRRARTSHGRSKRFRHARVLAVLGTLVTLSMSVQVQAQEPAGAVQHLSARDGVLSPSAFWAQLGDTTLARLVDTALESNRDVQTAEARIRGARAERTSALLELTPSITATAGYNRQRLSSATVPGAIGSLPDQEYWDAGVRMSWELDVFGRVRNRLEGRDALVDAAQMDTRDVEVLVAAEVAHTYFSLRGTQDRLAVARRNAENQQNTLELTQYRLEAGRGTALDTERAQAQLSSTRADIPALEAAIAAERNRIAVLLGQAPDSLQRRLPDGPWSAALPADLAVQDIDAVVRRRPDVLGAASRVEARHAFAGAARADYLPRLSVSGVAGFTANEIDALGNSGTPRYTFGPVISWPLLDLGRVKTGVDAARAEEAAAVAQHRQTVLRAMEEIESSLTAYHMARERLHHLEDAAAASERATDLARLRFEEGASDFLEVLDAERRMLEAQDRLAAGRTEATTWLVRVYRAVGGGAAMR